MSAVKYIVVGGGIAVIGFLLYQKLTAPTKTLGDNTKDIVNGVTGAVDNIQALFRSKSQPAPGQKAPLSGTDSEPGSNGSPFATALVPGWQNGSAMSDALGVRTNRQLLAQPNTPTPSQRVLGGNLRGNPYEIRPVGVARV